MCQLRPAGHTRSAEQFYVIRQHVMKSCNIYESLEFSVFMVLYWVDMQYIHHSLLPGGAVIWSISQNELKRFIVLQLNIFDGGELSFQINNIFYRFREKRFYRANSCQMHIILADARATFVSGVLRQNNSMVSFIMKICQPRTICSNNAVSVYGFAYICEPRLSIVWVLTDLKIYLCWLIQICRHLWDFLPDILYHADFRERLLMSVTKLDAVLVKEKKLTYKLMVVKVNVLFV